MVITDVNQVVYRGDGVTTAFPFTFRIIDATDIKLLLMDADGTETDIQSDYFVDTVNNTVHYPGYAPGAEPPEADQPAPVQTGQRLAIYRELPITQEKDLGDKWPFFVIELSLDKLTMILQQIYGWWGRTLKFSVGWQVAHPDFDATIPVEAGKTWRVNDEGTGFVATGDPDEAVVVANNAKDIAQEAKDVAAGAKTTAEGIAATAQEAKDIAQEAKDVAAGAKTTAEGIAATAQEAKDIASEAATSATNAANSAATAAAAAEYGFLKRNTAYKVGDIAYTTQLPAGYYLECVTAGTTGNTEPTISVGAENVNDGTVKWSVKNIQDASKSSLPVGFEAFTTNPTLQAGWLPLLGGEYSRTTYADLWAWVQTQNGYLLEESAWQAKAAANGGNVPFYSKGNGSTTFRVPALKCWVRGANSISEVGGYLAAGLPNITGTTNIRAHGLKSGNPIGALKGIDSGNLSMGGSDRASTFDVDIDASRSNSIYGNSSTVQPESIVGMWVVKAYGTVTNVGSTDVANISTGLTQAETRISTAETRISTAETHISTAETRISTLENQDAGAGIVAALLKQNGYVKFSNGLILQWGVVTKNVTATLFPVAFTVACASVVMTAISARGEGGRDYPINAQNITTTSFALRTKSNWASGDTARYIAVGY